jgi:N-acetylneuraminic acid mutarotase
MNTNIGDYFRNVRVPAPQSPKNRRGLKLDVRRKAKRTVRWVNGHRIVAGFMALLLLATAVLPTVYGLLQQRKYAVSSATDKVIAKANDELAKKLVYDEAKQAYVFNKENMPFDVAGSSIDKKAADQVATVRMLQAKADAQQTVKVGQGTKDEQLYSSQFPKDFAQGATYYDNEARLSFSLVPKFAALSGDRVGDRLVYPLKDFPGQAIYTVSSDGVKEDVVLQKYVSDKVTLEYFLGIPETLESRLLDSGAIGIYSADPSVYGASVLAPNADIGEAIKAQAAAPKSHLAFVIPPPHVAEADGNSDGVETKFVVKGNSVSVVTTGLSKASYPLSIDPTVVVASSSGFNTGNNESNSIVGTNAVQRQPTTGGDSTGSWTSTTTMNETRRSAGSASYNGYAYVVGGFNTADGDLNTVEYAAINSNGTLGSWASTTSLPGARAAGQAVAYDGYLYFLGGANTSSVPYSDVYIAPINSNGTLGSWASTTSLLDTRRSFGAAAYKGYMYVWGGSTTDSHTGGVATSMYAPIHANGTLGSWTSGTSFTTARSVGMSVQHNGYLYIMGGINTSGTTQTSVQSAPIQSDGTIGTWSANTALTVNRRQSATVVYGGYVYLIAGVLNGSVTDTTTYAPILANGTLGSWQTLNAVTDVTRNNPQALAANGYLYVLGGSGPSDTPVYATTRYVQISEAGNPGVATDTTHNMTTSRERHATAVWNGHLYQLGGYGGSSNNYNGFAQHVPLGANGNTTATETVGTSFTTVRADLGGVAYNGYLYALGGYNGSTDTYYANVQYHAIASDGTISGAWSSTTALPTARGGIDVAAYNGYMYVMGGRDSGGNLDEVQYAVINSDGTLGSWSTTTVLPSAMNRMRVAAYNGYMYVMGGGTHALPAAGTGASPSGSRATGAGASTVYYAPINSNGTVGSWTATSSLNLGRSEFGGAVSNGVLYATGGFHNTSPRTNIEYAKINADGSVGTWQFGPDLASGDLNAGSTSAEAYNGHLYSTGGRDDTNITNTQRTSQTNYWTIRNGGSGAVNTWTTSGNTLPAGRSYATSVHLNGYAYVIGGNAVANYYYAALNRDGTVGSWSSAQTFPATLTGASAVTYKGRIYVVGGNTTDVYYAQPASNGSIASWTATTSLPAAIQHGGAAQHNGSVYLVGGAVGSTSQTTVYYAQIMPDGSLGAWQTNGNVLPAARSHQAVTAANGYLYALAGYNGTSDQTGTYYARVNPDGSVGPWATSILQLPTALSGAMGVAVGGHIYLSGGASSDKTYRTSITHDGAITGWEVSPGVSMPATKIYASGVYANGYMYNFGGNASTTVYYSALTTVPRVAEYSKLIDLGTTGNIQTFGLTGLRADNISARYRLAGLDGVFGSETSVFSHTYSGKVVPWTTTNALSGSRQGSGGVVLNGYAYVVGGSTSVLYAKLNADGTTASWATAGTLAVNIKSNGVAAANGYVYAIGGSNTTPTAQTAVYYAKQNADGTLASFATTTALGTATTRLTAVTANGYIYVLGGGDESGSKYATTYYAPLNADGSIGSWTSTTALPNQRESANAVVLNGYVYVLGGNGGSVVDTVYYAPLNSNGTIGSWSSTTALPAVRHTGSVVTMNGYIYYIGGTAVTGTGGQVSTVYYAQANSNGTIGSWSTSTSTVPVALSDMAAVAAYGYVYLMGGLDASSTAVSTVYYGRLSPVYGTDLTSPTRYVRMTVTMDETQANGSFPEVQVGELKGLYIDYRIVPAPASRLYGGKFFSNGQLQPLIQPGTNPEN